MYSKVPTSHELCMSTRSWMNNAQGDLNLDNSDSKTTNKWHHAESLAGHNVLAGKRAAGLIRGGNEARHNLTKHNIQSHTSAPVALCGTCHPTGGPCFNNVNISTSCFCRSSTSEGLFLCKLTHFTSLKQKGPVLVITIRLKFQLNLHYENVSVS